MLEIEALVEVVGAIIAFLPGLIGAIIIIIVGYMLGNYVRRQVKTSGVAYSDLVGAGLFFILYISVALALPLVGIDPTLVNNILLLLVGAVAIGGAIALGLGAKNTVGELIKDYQKKMEKEQKKS
ncbi:mechanosensitive ion channel family protein [[Eubacterium] cellulosolvens]